MILVSARVFFFVVGVEEGYAAETIEKIGILDEEKGCIKWARKRRREEVNEWTAATLTSGPHLGKKKNGQKRGHSLTLGVVRSGAFFF